jgi:hypothetical protein
MEGSIHYELLERNLTVTAESYCQQLRRLEKTIQQKSPGRRFFGITTTDHTHCKQDESGHSGTRL